MSLIQQRNTWIAISLCIVFLALVIFLPEYKICLPQSYTPSKGEIFQQHIRPTNRVQPQINEPTGHKIKMNKNLSREKNFESSEAKEKCKKRLPQAIVVGIQKCGTTALVKFLGAHPQIAAYDYEAQYFYGDNYEKHSLDWYRDLMPCSYSNQITIEKSPPYFYRDQVAGRIRNMDPKTKIIIIVKDPITRAVSMYAMLKEYNKVEGKSFEDCITLNDNKTINKSSRFIDFSNYPKHVRSWLNTFNRKDILVLDGHNMELDPARELMKVEDFLHIRRFLTPDKFAFNETKGKYCLKVGTELNCLIAKKGRRHPNVDQNIRKSLESYFTPLNEKFFSMINERFDWGY